MKVNECKFTPLGFETLKKEYTFDNVNCVNLPRWGLKLLVKVDDVLWYWV